MEGSLTNLYPTLIECFGVILMGYIAGRCNWFTVSEGKGISLFISYIALPALIFKAMVEVDFAKIDWLLWTGLLLSKTIVFVLAAIMALVFHKNDKVGRAGLYGIFVTQSNDFAFGLPLLQSIFNHPSNKYLLDYVYLVAPISLAFLNPLGFAMLEYQKAKNESNSLMTASVNTVTSKKSTQSMHKPVSLKRIALRTLKGIATNPFVFMILFGIIANFILKQQIPHLIKSFFNSLGSAFGPTALFYLGWNLGNNTSKVKGMGFLVPAFLVAGKGIMLPVIMRQIVSSITSSSKPLGNVTQVITANSTDIYMDDLSTFAFLYGAVPTAPTVLIYAGRYSLAENVIGSGLVTGTVLAAPIIFASIKMLEVKDLFEVSKFTELIGHVCSDVSILTVICSAWVIGVFLWLRFYRRKPHLYTLMLFVSQLVLGLMGSTYKLYSGISNDIVLKILLWVLLLSLFSCCCWTSVISIALSFGTKLDAANRKKWQLAAFTYGLGMPACLATLVLLLSPNIVDRARSHTYFFLSHCFKQYGGLSVSFMVLNVFTILTIVVSMIKLKHSDLVTAVPYDNIEATIDRSCVICPMASENRCSFRPLDSSFDKLDSYPGGKGGIDIENLDKCILRKTQVATNTKKKEKDVTFLRNIEEMEQLNLSRFALADRYHLTNHVILILMMAFSIIMNLTLSLWSLLHLNNHAKGIYLEIEMLDIVCIYGQGFISFAVFGFVKEVFALPIVERLTRSFSKCFRIHKISLKDVSELDPETITLCNKFRDHHLVACSNEVVSNFRFTFKTYRNVFKGTALVNWVLENGLVKQRSDAIKYCNQLLLGRVIQHSMQRYYFYDLPYIYQFVTASNDTSSMSESSSSNQISDGEPVSI